jgi:hypothetical protein
MVFRIAALRTAPKLRCRQVTLAPANRTFLGFRGTAPTKHRAFPVDPTASSWVLIGRNRRDSAGVFSLSGGGRSTSIARRLRARGGARRLDWELSLDEVGRDRPFWLRSPVAAPRAGVERALLAAGRRARVPVGWVRDEGSGNSDQREIELLGMPGAKLGVGAGGEPCRHSPCDRPSRLDPRSLSQARRLVAEALR